jgi:hypothetical protein
MNRNDFSIGGDRKPQIEINKSTRQKFWQNPNFTLLLYLLFILLSFQVWQGYQQARQQEIPLTSSSSTWRRRRCRRSSSPRR